MLLKSLFIASSLTTLSFAQGSSWQRAEPAAGELQLFHSLTAAMLPTAETLQKGDWDFEVSHRFTTPVNQGNSSFLGMDGPATIRLALGYAVNDELILHIGRTNAMDNVELTAKYKAVQIDNETLPIVLGVRGGIAYNGEIYDPVKSAARRFQYYGQLIANALVQKKIGVGLAPTYLYNAHIFCVDPQYSFTFGSYIQYYVSPRWSLLVEWNPTVIGWRRSYDSLTLGFELETGGHFFKIFLTNNDRMNTAQYVAGADRDFFDGDIRIGFLITRTF